MAGDRSIAVFGQVAKLRLEIVAALVVEVENREDVAGDGSAEDKTVEASADGVESAAQSAAAFAEKGTVSDGTGALNCIRSRLAQIDRQRVRPSA